MSVADAIQKAATGQELSGEERDALKNFHPEGIPKSRLDAEIAKRKECESQNSQLTQQLQELNAKVETLENRDLSELDIAEKKHTKEVKSLQDKLTAITEQYSNTTQELQQLKFSNQVKAMAAEFKFEDVDFLEYLIKDRELSLDNESEVTNFMEELKKSSPKHFRLDLRSGSGSRLGLHDTEFIAAEKKGDITGMLQHAPEVFAN